MLDGYMDIGNPDKVCPHCKAVMRSAECNNKSTKYHNLTFSICCRNGQVQIPPERHPPPFLVDLLSGGPWTTDYKKNMRIYNSLFAFTSLGGKIDHKINKGRASYIFKLHGQNYHLIGTICPMKCEIPKYCQLYVYDTENEAENRKNAVSRSDKTDPDIVNGFLLMLNEHNSLVHGFRTAHVHFEVNEPHQCTLTLLERLRSFQSYWTFH